MSEDFHKVRDAVRNGEYLKAKTIRLYKYRNVLKPIQIWESTPEGRRQNYEAVNEKQKLIQNVQTEINRRQSTFCKLAGKWLLGFLTALAVTVLGAFLYHRFFSPATPLPQKKPLSIETQTQQETKNTPVSASPKDTKQNKSQSNTK